MRLATKPHDIHIKNHDDDCPRVNSTGKTFEGNFGISKEYINEYEKTESKPRKKKTKETKIEEVEEDEKEDEESFGEVAKKISKKRKNEAKGDTTSSEQICKLKKASLFEDWKKHEPLKKEGETEKQIKVLEKIAVYREGCACFVGEDTKLEELCYDTQAEAKKAILEQVKLSEAKNSQLCSAFSILKKNNKYLILETNSTHSKPKAEITNNDKVKKIRPAVEPEKRDFPFVIKNKTHVIYGFSSCNVCCEHKADNAIVFDVPKNSTSKKKFKDHFIDDKLSEVKITDFPEKRDSQVSFANNPLHPLVTKRFKDKKSQVVFAGPIQPPGCVTQDGWSLHHSEIECYVFAKRHGWEIVAIYIDRDCCPVCASTLNEVDVNAYNAITSFYTLKTELEPPKENN